MPDPAPKASRRALLVSGGLTLLALGLRLVHLLTIRDAPLFNHLFIDLRMYDLWAQRIAAGEWIRDTPFFLDPLYPYFVGLIFAVFGHDYVVLAIVQSLLVALLPALLYITTRRWFDESTAIVSGVLMALYLPGIYWAPLLMKPALSMFLVTVALVLFSRALRGVESWPWLAAGSVMMLAALTRTTLTFMLPVLGMWILLRDAPKLRLRAAGAFSAGVILVVSLTFAHNLAASGEPILTTANHGAIFYLGNNEDNPNGGFLQMSFLNPRPEFEQRDFMAEAERRAGRTFNHRQASRFWLGEGLRFIREQPLGWVAVSWRKLRMFWGIYETPASLDYYLYREYAPVLRLPLPGFGLLGPLALLGMLLAVRRPGWPRLLIVYTVAACLSAVLFFVLTRFRMVLVPALCVFAGFGAVELVRRARRAEWKPVALALAVLLAGFVFVNIPVRLPEESRALRLAATLGLPTRPATTALAHFNLGVTYASLARQADAPDELLDLAETELRKAVERQPEARTWVELGKVLARREANREAIEAYREAQVLEPGEYRTHHALGLLLRREGDVTAAAQAFQRALQLQPRSQASAVQLGELLLEQGRNEAAAEAFRYALGIKPDDKAAQRGLARATGTR